jgi:hypothetical protein
MGKDDARLRSCRSGGAMSLLQAASLVTTVAIYFLNGFFFFGGCFCGCLQAIALAGVEIDTRTCVRRMRASRAHRIRKVQIDTLFCFARRRRRLPHLIFRGWDFSFAQSMNQLATSSSF